MSRFGPGDTQWLTRADFEPTAGRRRGALILVTGLLALFALAAGSGHLDGLPGSQAQQRNVSLTGELEHLRVELAMERATRAELQRQADELSDRVNELNQQLEFLTSRTAQAGRTR